MVEIRLQKGAWQVDTDRALGPSGGFGAVFLGKAANGSEVAVKRIHLATDDKSVRELAIAEYFFNTDLLHVIPILDAGLDSATARHYIVMARADSSLQELIDKSAPLGEPETVEIALSIAAGIQDIGAIVHRDLKPANVLLHHGVWKLADWGLARFMEDATSSHTMKEFLSPPYATPEQWRGESITKATDTYALGCVIYAVRTGKPPFPGPERADYGRQHLTETPPALEGSPAMNRLVTSCLAKNPLVRPSIESVISQLTRIKNPPQRAAAAKLSVASGALLRVSEELERKRAEDEARALQEQANTLFRRNAAAAAVQGLTAIWRDLSLAIQAEAPNATIEPTDKGLKIRLGNASLTGEVRVPVFESQTSHFGRDVLAMAFFGVSEGWTPSRGRGRRSANLWFAAINGGSHYRWFEAGYMYAPAAPDWVRVESILKYPNPEPFGIGADDYDFDGPGLTLLSYVNNWFKLAYNPRPIDGEDFDDFCLRWAEHLAKAVVRQLDRPARLPEEDVPD